MKKHIALTFVALLLAPPAALHAAEATLKVNVDQPDGKIPETFYGAFFEDINYSADGGLYAELIQNRSFEYDPALASPDISVGEINQHADAVMRTMGKLTPLYAWRETSGCEIVVCNEKPLNADNTHYLEIRSKPESQIAILNSGYDGIPVKQGKKYNFSFFARRDGQLDAPITISLVTPKGDVAGQGTATPPTNLKRSSPRSAAFRSDHPSSGKCRRCPSRPCGSPAGKSLPSNNGRLCASLSPSCCWLHWPR